MRDAIGGTFMIKILLIFIAVFIIFVAVALNYARAFRIKNQVIDIIEQNEGIQDYNEDNVVNQIENMMREKSYMLKINEDECDENYYDIIRNVNYGYCIGKYNTETSSLEHEYVIAEYYRVVTFVTIRLPIFENFNITIPVKGETRKIERVKEE